MGLLVPPVSSRAAARRLVSTSRASCDVCLITSFTRNPLPAAVEPPSVWARKIAPAGRWVSALPRAGAAPGSPLLRCPGASLSRFRTTQPPRAGPIRLRTFATGAPSRACAPSAALVVVVVVPAEPCVTCG